jgi:hypothetical protein
MRSVLLVAMVACGASKATRAPAPCPTAGPGAIVTAGASCLLVTPAATGADPSGEGADVPSYALAPTGAPSGKLVLFLNGTGGTPAGAIVHPTENVYNVFAAAGHHVLALSYRSSQALANLCFGVDACFLPTRETIVSGEDRPGSVLHLERSEGIEPRLVLALRALAAAAPHGGWDMFLDGDAVRWPRVIATGHSQGGGHAALLAKLHPLARFVGLSSPCDMVGGTAASWQRADETWQTSPADAGYGFSAATTFDAAGVPIAGDLNCPAHAATWSALGLDASHRFDDAIVCGTNPHAASIACSANFARIAALFAITASGRPSP